MSDSDSDAMGEEFPFDMSDLERETNMVIVDLDRRDDWDDRPESPCAAGVRKALLSTAAFEPERPPTFVSSGWAVAPPSSSTSPGALPFSVVAAAEAERPVEFVTLRVGEAIAPVEHRRDRGISGSGGGKEEATSPMACVTSSDAQAHPAPRDIDDVAASGTDQALDPAPRDIEHATSGGGGEEALDPAPMFNTTSGGEARDLVPTSGIVPSGTEAEPYRPVMEPVSPYRAPTPTERSELMLNVIHSAMVTSVAGGTHQQATLLYESRDKPLTVEVVQLLVQAMSYSRTEATQALQRQVIVLQGLGLPSDAVIAQLLATLDRMLEYDATRDI